MLRDYSSGPPPQASVLASHGRWGRIDALSNGTRDQPALPEHSPTSESLRRLAAATPGLALLVLHGSRARGDARDESDWDFAYLGTNVDAAMLAGELGCAVRSDRLDLADLDRAGGLVRYRVARDGRCAYERIPGTFDRFRISAIRFWLDVERVVREQYAEVLAELG